MTRPCFLVVDQEFASSISTRKLVIETAKFNVITAYSGAEAIATVKRFPAIDGIVLDIGIKDIEMAVLIQELKAAGPKKPIILVGRSDTTLAAGVDYHLQSFDPAQILTLLKKLEPERAAAIEQRNQLLVDESLSGRQVCSTEIAVHSRHTVRHAANRAAA